MNTPFLPRYREGESGFQITGSFLDNTIHTSSQPEFKNEIEDYGLVINVADTPCMLNQHHNYHWIPIIESGVWSIESLFAFTRLLQFFRVEGKPTLIHCHAGVCRSKTMLAIWTKAIHPSQLTSQQQMDIDYVTYKGQVVDLDKKMAMMKSCYTDYPTYSAECVTSKANIDYLPAKLKIRHFWIKINSHIVGFLKLVKLSKEGDRGKSIPFWK